MFLLHRSAIVCFNQSIRVTLRRIQKPSRESPHFVSLNITVLRKGYKESQFYKLTVIVANEPYTDQLYLQKSTSFLFTSFTLIPQYLKRFNWSKTRWNKQTLKTKQRNPLTFRLFSLASTGLHDFKIFPDRKGHAWSLEAGDICSPAKNVWLVDARPRDFAKFKMAAIPPSFVRRLIAA